MNWTYSYNLKYPKKTYDEFGSYDYGLKADDMVDIKKWEGEYDGYKAIYFGQLKGNSPHNFGIMVKANGTT